jgi:hypothetical protein
MSNVQQKLTVDYASPREFVNYFQKNFLHLIQFHYLVVQIGYGLDVQKVLLFIIHKFKLSTKYAGSYPRHMPSTKRFPLFNSSFGN